MKKIVALMATSALMLGAHAENWEVRIRALDVVPLTRTYDSNLRSAGLDVKNDVIPEVDFTYFINPHLGTELILGTSRHKVDLGGAQLGHVDVLPPTLTLQYHFLPESQLVRPYLGAGVNYTRFYAGSFANGLYTTRQSFGPALQAGLDIPVSSYGYLNFDVKKLWAGTQVRAPGDVIVTHLRIDPMVWGLGYGIRF